MNAVSAYPGIDVAPLVVFLLWTAVAAWLVFFGGAEWVEDSYSGTVLVGLLCEASPDFPARAIKWFVSAVWSLTLAGMVAMGAL